MSESPANSTLPDAAAEPIPPRYWWLKRILIGAGALLVLLIAMRIYWGYEADRRIQAEIARYRAAGQPVFPEDFVLPPIPDEDNAALLLEQAVEIADLPYEDYHVLATLVDDPSEYASLREQVERILESYVGALDLVRESRTRPAVRWSALLEAPSPHRDREIIETASKMSVLVRLAHAALMYHDTRGDDAAAVECMRDMVFCTDSLGALAGYTITHLTTCSMTHMFKSSIEWASPRLLINTQYGAEDAGHMPAGRRQVQSLISELLNEDGAKEGWRNAWLTERAETAEFLASHVGRSVPAHEFLRRYRGDHRPYSPVINIGAGYLLSPLFKTCMLHECRHSTAQLHAGERPDYKSANRELLRHSFPDKVIDRVVALNPSFSLSRDFVLNLHWSAISLRRMAATALAIRMYEIDHGSRPLALADLVPDYLPYVPKDPFSEDGRPISYKPDLPTPVLYCWGVNGVDEGGDSSTDPEHTMCTRDVVFHLDGPPPLEFAVPSSEQDDGGQVWRR